MHPAGVTPQDLSQRLHLEHSVGWVPKEGTVCGCPTCHPLSGLTHHRSSLDTQDLPKHRSPRMGVRALQTPRRPLPPHEVGGTFPSPADGSGPERIASARALGELRDTSMSGSTQTDKDPLGWSPVPHLDGGAHLPPAQWAPPHPWNSSVRSPAAATITQCRRRVPRRR